MPHSQSGRASTPACLATHATKCYVMKLAMASALSIRSSNILISVRLKSFFMLMFNYFPTFAESFNRFPGFNYEVQGVYQEQVEGRITFYTYAVRN
jgi:hypothetical protein